MVWKFEKENERLCHGWSFWQLTVLMVLTLIHWQDPVDTSSREFLLSSLCHDQLGVKGYHLLLVISGAVISEESRLDKSYPIIIITHPGLKTKLCGTLDGLEGLLTEEERGETLKYEMKYEWCDAEGETWGEESESGVGQPCQGAAVCQGHSWQETPVLQQLTVH